MTGVKAKGQAFVFLLVADVIKTLGPPRPSTQACVSFNAAQNHDKHAAFSIVCLLPFMFHQPGHHQTRAFEMPHFNFQAHASFRAQSVSPEEHMVDSRAVKMRAAENIFC